MKGRAISALMMRGVPVHSDPFFKARMIDWYYEEKGQEVMRTLIDAYSSMLGVVKNPEQLGNDLQDLIKKYQNSVWCFDKEKEDLAEKHKDLLEGMENQEFTIREASLSGISHKRDSNKT